MLTGIHKIPVHWEQATTAVREKYLDRYYEYRRFSNDSNLNVTGPNSLHDPKINIHRVLQFILSVNEKNCKQ